MTASAMRRLKESRVGMADLMCAYEIPCTIHTVDIKKMMGVSVSGVTFYEGDARNLSAAYGEAFMAKVAQPMLVIEDADHVKETTLAALRFFEKWLRPGEYLIVEDSIVTDIGIAGQFDDGRLAAIEEFLHGVSTTARRS